MKKIILVLILFVFSGCKLLKKVDKKDSDTKLTETITRNIVRAGDTVRFDVPSFHFKDTTIYTTNVQGTTIRTVFDDSGDVSQIECMSSVVNELMTINRELMQKLSEKQKEENGKTDPWFWIPIILVAGAVIIIIKKI